jgi:CheY-like chemotaxis protein
MNSTIPIIALTADVTSVDIEKCKSAGMNDYVSKPIDEKTLYKKIIKYIKKPIHQKIGANERAGRITQTRAEMH